MKLATTVLALIVAAHASAAVRARYLMGTLCEVSAADERQIEKAFAEAARVEAMLSTWRDDSELARLNANPSAPISPELASVLRVVDEQCVKTGGAFEPHIRPLIDAWKTREEGALPDAAAIAKALDEIRRGNPRSRRERSERATRSTGCSRFSTATPFSISADSSSSVGRTR